MDLGVGELLVGRLWRWDRERLEQDVDVDRRDKLDDGETDPAPSVSVFAVRHMGGPIEPTVERLKQAIKASRNGKWLALVTEGEITGHGFTLTLSEPPADHYDLGLTREATGETTSEAIVCLEGVFGTREKVRL